VESRSCEIQPGAPEALDGARVRGGEFRTRRDGSGRDEAVEQAAPSTTGVVEEVRGSFRSGHVEVQHRRGRDGWQGHTKG